jgi:SAM-dependent methyltransferase
MVDTQRTDERANSFGKEAALYARSRPSYPAEVADWLIPDGASTVLDLGAGTGKFTASLVGRGLEVTAVEPDPLMLSTLVDGLPSVKGLAGSAEEIPLADASVDLITAAQAWHWVDEERALPEAARVLRPGGMLGLVWNIRDEGVDWVHELSGIIQHSEAERALRHGFTIGAPFGETERLEVAWERPMDADALVDLVASRSDIITATPEHRRAVLAGVRELVATHPDLAGRQSFSMPYRTYVFRAAAPATRIR